MNKIIVLIVWFVIHMQSSCKQGVKAQNYAASVEIRKCLEYKKAGYEEQHSFGFFMYNAQEENEIIDNCNSSYVPFIVGGEAANPKEFPHAARLGNARLTADGVTITWFCGGTLISEKFVLTAAHCFYATQGEVNRVRLGELNFDTERPHPAARDYNVRRNIAHPDYVANYNYNDIGLIELQEQVSFSRFILPACLPISSGNEHQDFLAIGWGSTTFAGSSSKKLLKVKLELYAQDYCDSLADSDIAHKLPFGINKRLQMCAGSHAIRDTCNGDSGGPLLAHHAQYPCMYYVVGVTSSGFGGCGTPDIPAIYTRVYNYMHWIRRTVWP